MSRRLGVIVGLLALLAAVIVLALFLGGASSLPASDVARWLSGGDLGDRQLRVEALIMEYRLPRAVLMAMVGMALAVCGAALQASLQNPLADPSLLGVTSGASLGAVGAIVLGFQLRFALAVPLAAFAAALITLLLTYMIANAAGRGTTAGLLLTGVALGSLCSATVAVLLVSVGDHRVHEIVAWMLGSAEGRGWQDLRWAVGPVAIGCLLLLILARPIDALALGEEHAIAVGVDVSRTRALVFTAVALAAGGAVSVAGPVAFVGLIVPHAARALVGSTSARLIPIAALAGAVLLVLCETVSRMLSREVEIPVGIVTALIGVPFFLVLLIRSSR